MGQDEVYLLLEKKPRLCSAEIARELKWSIKRVCMILNRMKLDLIEDEPSDDEVDRIMRSFPTKKYNHVIGRMKVFEVKE